MHDDRHLVPGLMERCLPELDRRSRHLLPRSARTYMCPSDLVQDVMLTTWRVSANIAVDEQAGLLLYLQRALTNRARSEARRARRRAFHDRHLHREREVLGPSPLDMALATERQRQVQEALAALPLPARQLVIARHVRQLSWSRVAEDLGYDSPDAARVATARVVRRLAGRLRDALL